MSFSAISITRDKVRLFTSLRAEIDQKLFFLNKDLIFMVPGFFDLNCNKSGCVKLPFLGQEIIERERKKEGINGKSKRREYTIEA